MGLLYNQIDHHHYKIDLNIIATAFPRRSYFILAIISIYNDH